MAIDSVQRAFYGLHFENTFLQKRGKEFEIFFARIMGHVFPGDFEPVRPYGPRGDLKCDGFLSSSGTVCQCYAPDAMKLDELLAKIREDFGGAVQHWSFRMKRWIFVHNDGRGLPAEAVQYLDYLRVEHPGVEIETWSYAKLREYVMSLPIDRLEDLFGSVPSGRTLDTLNFAKLRPVLLAIQRREPAPDQSIRAPSVHKLEANKLSDDAAWLLRQGRRRERLVQEFFDEWPDPSFGEEIAEAFRARYSGLKKAGLSPDQIFGELQVFAGGMSGDPSHQGAVLAVMSYFFERCDIFEEPIPVAVR